MQTFNAVQVRMVIHKKSYFPIIEWISTRLRTTFPRAVLVCSESRVSAYQRADCLSSPGKNFEYGTTALGTKCTFRSLPNGFCLDRRIQNYIIESEKWITQGNFMSIISLIMRNKGNVLDNV